MTAQPKWKTVFELIKEDIQAKYEIEDIIEDCEVYVYGSYGEISC